MHYSTYLGIVIVVSFSTYIISISLDRFGWTGQEALVYGPVAYKTAPQAQLSTELVSDLNGLQLKALKALKEP